MTPRHTELRTSEVPDTHEAVLLNCTGVEEDDLVLLEAASGDGRVVLRPRVRTETFGDQWVKINPNLLPLFSRQNPSEVVVSGGTAAQRQVEICEHVKIAVESNERSAVERYFEKQRLIHPVTEVRSLGEREIQFQPFDIKPHSAAETFLFLPDETDIEFVDPDELRTHGADGNTGAEDDSDVVEEPYSTRLKRVEMSDVVGLDGVKQHANSLIDLYNDRTYAELTDKYSESIISKEGSVLLYGPPGCGKTMIAQAVANEFVDRLDRDVVYMEVTGSDVLSKLQGESEKKVRLIFEDARQKAGSTGFVVLFFDEVENLVAERSGDSLQASRVSITNEFLTQMNSIEENVMVIGATNLPYKVDSAAARRFHTKLLCPHPGPEGMAEKWRLSLAGVTLKEEIDYERLGEATAEYTPAEVDDRILGGLVQTELVSEYRRGQPKELTTDYLLGKIAETAPRTIPEYVARMEGQLRRGRTRGYTELEEYVREFQDDS